MSDTKTATQELQGEILKTVRKSQETVVDAIQMWADAVQAIKPPLPEVNIPFSDKLPKPGDLVSGAYDFAEQLLAAQRKFAEDVLHATAPLFYGAYGVSVLVAITIVLIPGAPLVPILFLSQALNAVLLLAILPFLRALARDRELMGAHRLGRLDSLATAVVIALVAVSVVALGVLSVF